MLKLRAWHSSPETRKALDRESEYRGTSPRIFRENRDVCGRSAHTRSHVNGRIRCRAVRGLSGSVGKTLRVEHRPSKTSLVPVVKLRVLMNGDGTETSKPGPSGAGRPQGTLFRRALHTGPFCESCLLWAVSCEMCGTHVEL